MQRYILVRVLQSIITLLVLSVAIFGLARISGDPRLLMLPAEATDEDFERLNRVLGLDKPIAVQYGIFLGNALKGDFGNSIRVKAPVIDLIKERLPNSVMLTVTASLMAYLLGLPLGITAAYRRGGVVDGVARLTAALGQAIPGFYLALMLMLIFAVKLGWFPTSGMEGWTHFVLPCSALAFFIIPGVIRLLRSSMLDVLDSEYIKVARIKGVSEGLILWKHAMRNALLPLVSFTGMQLARLVVGAIIVETVFAWPGFGRLAFESIMKRDFPMMQAVVLVGGLFILVANLLADISYAYLDPRVRY